MKLTGRLARQERIELLTPLALFEDFSRRELARVADIAVEADVRPGTTLTWEGHDGRLMFVVVEGKAAVIRGGREIARVGPGEVFGELSLIDGRPRSASVKALTAMRVLQLTGEEFDRLVDVAPHFAHNVLASLARRIRATDAKIV